jgi:prolyl-tRNA synthetase
MNNAGAQELLMPALIPSDIFEASGRMKNFGSSVFTLEDRYDKKYVLAPTHEELFAIASSLKVKSYKDLPFNLYQFQTKFRDEARPRYGAIRVREFIMKDAYSFDVNNDGLDISYNKMFNAYKSAFNKMGINYKIVKADTGVMGGMLSEEFQAVTDIGEDVLVLCDKCDYASNIEVSECVTKETKNNDELLPIQKLHTPNVGKIKDLVNDYKLDVNNLVKSMVYKIDNEFYMVIVAGDDAINEVKLQKLFNASLVVLADEADVNKITNAKLGFAGPKGIKIKVLADNKIKHMKNIVIGANEDDYHYVNANAERDFKVDMYHDIRNIKENDICPKCGGKIYFKRGIEIGNTFKLGTKYSEALNVNYLDHNNQLNPVVMGSYGIGLGRCMAAIAEQNNDEKGIIWPMSVAPFKVGIVLINPNDATALKFANELYDYLNNINISVLLDDRDERPGVKFNDMDLIGLPIRITIGKKINENTVEMKLRNSNENIDIKVEDIIFKIKELIN